MENKKITIKDYDTVKQKYSKLLETEKNLNAELNNINEQQKNLEKELADIESSIEQKSEEINKAKLKGTSINQEELHKKCKDAIDHFLIDVYPSNQEGLNLQIRIEYKQMKISKTLNDENMTFEKLKNETKLQFGKDANEFYFTDDEGNIFLDELRVVSALFPLSSVKVDNYEPVIKVVDKTTNKKKKEITFIKNEEEEFNDKEEDPSWLYKIGEFFKKNLALYFAIVFIIFLAMWMQSCINFLQAVDHRAIRYSFLDTNLLKLEENIEFDDVLNKVKEKLQEIFGDDSQYKLFKEANKINGKIRVVQKISQTNQNCKSDRLKAGTKDCMNLFDESKTPKKLTIQSETITYTKTPCKDNIDGLYNSYDNSGYAIDFDFEDINNIDLSISENTKAIIVILNIYNKNINAVITYRELFEVLGQQVTNQNKINITFLDQTVDGYCITSIVLSIILLGLIFFLLKKEDKLEVSKEIKAKGSFCERMKENYRLPNLFEWIFIVNVFFYYGLLIFRYSYVGSIKNNKKKEYLDYQSVSYRNELVTILCAFNILIFYSVLLSILNNFLSEFQVITKTIRIYLKTLFPFIICICFPFLMISMFVSFFMFGDFYHSFYKKLSFIFAKVLQSFFRGSLDNKDYNPAVKDNNLINMISIGNNQYTDIVSKVGHSGYIIYSLLFYFFAHIFIKGCVIGCCYLTYRNQYIITLSEIAKKKKEAKIAERVKRRREEEQKAQEDENKNNKNDEKKTENKDNKEMEMIKLD